MRDAILDAAQFGRYSGMAGKIYICGQINRALGTHLTPWELDEAPFDWVTALEMWVMDYPRARTWSEEVRKNLERLRGVQ